MNLRSWKFSIIVPGEMRPLIEAKMAKEKYDGISEYGCSLFLYDVCSDRPHRVTSPLMREPQWSKEAIMSALLAKAQAGEQAEFGGWFERIVEERVAQRIAEEKEKEAKAKAAPLKKPKK